ncbi:MAG: Maf family protein [Bryobacteraceae bacterium]
MRRLVLASGSPRRREILRNAGLPFEVRVAAVAEVRRPGECPRDYVTRLAREKAHAVASADDEIVLAADTTVVAGEAVLEKPTDAADARRMLRVLAGQVHTVITGICLRGEGCEIVDFAETEVRFTAMTNAEIDDYVASGEPMDKAGGYAIQGLASKFVDRVDGCYWNVVGLPIALVYARLKRDFGFFQSEDAG